MKVLSILLSLLIFFGCRRQDVAEPPPLTYEQRSAILWADWGAGFASVELGPGSFAVAAAASLSMYFNTISQISTTQQHRILNSNFDTTYINELDRVGVDHNKVCKLYILDENHNFNLFKQYAVQVRPDLYEQIILLEDSYFNDIYNSVISVNFNDASSILSFIQSHVDLNNADSQRLYSHLQEILDNINNEVLVEYAIDDIISEINTYSITQNDKEKLLISFYILKNSNTLWRD